MDARQLSIILSIFLLACPLFAQSDEGSYMQIDYLKVGTEHVDLFLEHAEAMWKNVQVTRVETGEITHWHLYKVNYPGSRNADYNYVSVTIANSLDAFESPPTASEEPERTERFQRVSSTLDPLRNVIHSELWKVANSVRQMDEHMPSRFIVMDYMKVGLGREYEYQMFEDEIARPLHEQRMNIDRMEGWELYELIVPGGINYGYNFATGNFYSKLRDIEFGFTDELIRQTHPEVNIMDFFQEIFEIRDLVQSELWELIRSTEDVSE